jgi:hypothetical protein
LKQGHTILQRDNPLKYQLVRKDGRFRIPEVLYDKVEREMESIWEQVRKRVFLRHVVLKMPSFYQDRLGTNIEKLKTETRFLIEERQQKDRHQWRSAAR